MTQEDKARRYDDAIEIAKAWCDYEQSTTDDKILLKRIFPELKESEDERIRKALIEYLRTLPNHFSHNGSLVIDWIAWLEKQAHKFVWSEEDKNMLEWIIGYLENKMLNAPISEERTACKNAIAWLKSLKDIVQPQSQWKPSDEQMKVLEELVEDNNQRYFYTILRSLYEQLKKLREE